VLNACYINIFVFLHNERYHADIDNWRRWNVRALFGMLFFHGTINTYFSGINFFTQKEAIYGLIAGIAFTYFSMDSNWSINIRARKKIVKALNATIFRFSKVECKKDVKKD